MEIKGDKKDFLQVIMGLYVIVIGVGVPLFVTDMYFNILVDKYYFYCICTITLIFILLLYFIKCKNKALIIKKISIKSVTITDCALCFFLLVCILSTITSDYFYESFWGNEGRLTGLFLLILYTLSFFCVSKIMKFRKIYIDCILFAGMLVCLFGIGDYFKMDILGFAKALIVEQQGMFTSTIGNINTYTAYVGIIVAISTVLFTMCKDLRRMIIYYLCMVISFFAIIMGISDNAYLSLGVLFGFLPLCIFNENVGIRRYLIVIATFFSVIQCIDWINVFLKEWVVGIDSVFDVIIEFKYLHFIVIFLWIVILAWYLIGYINNKSDKENFGNVLRYIWMGIIALIFLGICYAIYDCNVLGNIEKYKELSKYLVFNDEWGTHRGYIWRKSFECYLNFPVWKKIVGFGPETLGILLLQNTANNPYGQSFDNAHNEYIQNLLTIGAAGLGFYLTFIISYIIKSFRYAKKNPYIVALSFGVSCYSVQAFVNLNVPIVAPVYWLMIGMGCAILRESYDRDNIV